MDRKNKKMKKKINYIYIAVGRKKNVRKVKKKKEKMKLLNAP